MKNFFNTMGKQENITYGHAKQRERDGPCAVEKSCHVVLMYETQTKLSEGGRGRGRGGILYCIVNQ